MSPVTPNPKNEYTKMKKEQWFVFIVPRVVCSVTCCTSARRARGACVRASHTDSCKFEVAMVEVVEALVCVW